MDDEEIAKKKLKRMTGVKDLSSAIQKLERKKEAMEDDFKDEAHYFFENLNPVSLLNHTLQNLKESSSSKYVLFKKSLQFGAGYLSKKKLIGQLKTALLKTFSIPEKIVSHSTDLAINNQEDINKNRSPRESTQKIKEMILQNENEKVKAKPEVLPQPTYWPFFLAMGLMFLGWGLLTTWLISLAGFIVFVISLIGWINILRHE
jgi:hypothetical protein